ncbi:MAG: hypothetical protein RLZZ600_1110, partial [Actinomycetota bacterium]
MLKPFLLVGVGGSGGKTLRAVRDALEMKLNLLGWNEGFPTAWQFLHFDTPTVQDGSDFPAKFLPTESYVGLSTAHGNYENAISTIVSKTAKSQQGRLLRQLPDPSRVSVPLSKGAGQFRAVGRTAVMARLETVAAAARAAVANLNGASSYAQLARVTQLLTGKEEAPASGEVVKPVLIIVSSVAGGSGAGQYIDIADAVTAEINQDWANEAFGILYAPDVFDGVKGTAGVASNALAAISETTNGHWNRYSDDSVIEAFRGQGLSIQTGGAFDRVGVRYPLIVGRQNSNTAFEGQRDVYMSIAQTLAAWISVERFQTDINEYMSGNWSANTSRKTVQENSGFVPNNDDTPPFGAIGFGRITMAREKFTLYSQERLARSIIDRLLRAHELNSGNKTFVGQSAQAMIQQQADDARIGFFEATGFDEESINRNQVIDALVDRGQRELLVAQFVAEVRNDLGVGLPKSESLEQSDWLDRFQSSRTSRAVGKVSEDARLRGIRFIDWVARTPQQLLDTVSKYAVTHGLPVTERLLFALGESVERAANELDNEATERRNAVMSLRSYIAPELASAGPNAVRYGSDAFERAMAFVGQSLEWETDAINRTETAGLLREAKKLLIEPLRAFVASSLDMLNQTSTSQFTKDGRENDFKNWPGYDSNYVGSKYESSSNEKMLIDWKEFPTEFERLMLGTFTEAGTPLNAILLALPEVIQEDPKNPTAFLAQSVSWVPVATVGSNTNLGAARKPNFTMPQTPEEFLGRAEKWLTREGTAFGAYLKQSIRDFLDPETAGGPAEANKRQTVFMGHLASALNASAPLVKLNGTLLNAVHQSPGGNNRVISSPIPFKNGDAMYQQSEQVLLQNIPALAQDPNGASRFFGETNETSIEFFQVLGHGISAITISSIMEPIAADWNQSSNSSQSRSAFWQWKRARLLHESIPLDRMALDQLIAGWFTAQAFAMLIKGAEEGGLG